MSSKMQEQLKKAVSSLSKNQKQYILAAMKAAADAKHGNLSAKKAKQFARLFHGKHDARDLRSMARLLVSLGYLPQGFRLDED